MKKIFILTFVFLVLLSVDVFAYDLNIAFDNYGWYLDDVNNDGTVEKIWIVPVGGSYMVDKKNSAVDMNSFTLHYEMLEVLAEPEYINGHPIYAYNIDIGTKKGLEWYGSLDTYLGSGAYEGPDTEYFFDRTEMIYVNTGNNNNLTFGDFVSCIFSNNYPMTDPIPKDFYCLSATKRGEGDVLKTWYFKVLPYEYVAPTKVSATICDSGVTFNTFNIKGYNYIKIRDLAAAFKDTPYGFSVEWNKMGIRIHKGEKCNDIISTENMGNGYAHAVHSNGGIIYINDEEIASKSVECYNINGYNYYKIRDIAALLGFDVSFDSNTGSIECK